MRCTLGLSAGTMITLLGCGLDGTAGTLTPKSAEPEPTPGALSAPLMLQALELTEDDDLPAFLAPWGKDLFWISETGTLWRVSSESKAKATVLTHDGRPIRGLAAGGGVVAWIAEEKTGSVLLRMPASGGAITEVARGVVGAVTIEGTHVSWTGKDGMLRAPLAGGVIEAVSAGPAGATALTLGAEHLFWASGNDDASSRVYRSSRVATKEARTDILVPALSGTGPVKRGSLGLGDDALIWLDTAGRLHEVATAGGKPTMLDASGFSAWAPGGRYIYAAKSYGEGIQRLDRQGGPPTVAFPTPSQPKLDSGRPSTSMTTSSIRSRLAFSTVASVRAHVS